MKRLTVTRGLHSTFECVLVLNQEVQQFISAIFCKISCFEFNSLCKTGVKTKTWNLSTKYCTAELMRNLGYFLCYKKYLIFGRQM